MEDSQLEAAIAAISEPERMRAAQRLVARAAPSLQRVLEGALSEGGWFDAAHNAAARDAVAPDDPHERLSLVRMLLADETRLGMLVGVAVGVELARELGFELLDSEHPEPDTTQED